MSQYFESLTLFPKEDERNKVRASDQVKDHCCQEPHGAATSHEPTNPHHVSADRQDA